MCDKCGWEGCIYLFVRYNADTVLAHECNDAVETKLRGVKRFSSSRVLHPIWLRRSQVQNLVADASRET